MDLLLIGLLVLFAYLTWQWRYALWGMVRWPQMARDAGLDRGDRLPRLTRVTTVAPGVREYRVRLVAGQTVDDVLAVRERLRSTANVHAVEVERGRKGREAVIRWIHQPPPAVEPDQVSTVGAVELGRDVAGSPLVAELTRGHLLIAGETGSGKSTSLHRLLAQLASDPRVQLALIDPKRVELIRWHRRAAVVAVEPSAITILLGQIESEMEQRYLELAEAGASQLHPDGSRPLLVVVIDELDGVLNTGDRDIDKVNALVLRRLVQQGRAAGIAIVAATQKPSADVIPTAIRDQLAYRLVHRVSTRSYSDVALGEGLAAQGWDATGLQVGEAIARATASEPRRVYVRRVDPERIDQVAQMTQVHAGPWPMRPPWAVVPTRDRASDPAA